MIVLPIDYRDFGLDLAPNDTTRHPGLHMSDIYNQLYKELEPERYDSGTGLDPVVMGIGLALEQYTEKRLLASGIGASRPGQFKTEEGISFSPDLLIQNGTISGGEIKATNLSARQIPKEGPFNAFPPKFDKYMTQMKAYGHALEIPDWYLFAWFLKGEWKTKHEDGYLADFRLYHVEFTRREMAEEYRMLLNFAKQRRML